ncbi:hypothetical protein [Rhodoferax sediminis]|uniref:hypothetical protein n=1 Tax=Rhodoferax sediminis TaxID=2509614 RepID=UPI00143D1B99|nr:hypothetical protein [Rhodoferax sediminis]
MKTSSRKFQLLAVGAALAAGIAAPAQATLDLSGASYVTYGDANSYALQVDGTIAGSIGPGSPFYVNSTPGAIKDLIVVATGASGGPVNTNLPGMDNALSTPSGTGGSNFFSGIWNSTLAAFTGFANAAPIFFFNNNQVNSGASTNQNVAVWAQVSLTGAGQNTRYFDFTNSNNPYALFTDTPPEAAYSWVRQVPAPPQGWMSPRGRSRGRSRAPMPPRTMSSLVGQSAFPL